jgi:hypothetical protein
MLGVKYSSNDYRTAISKIRKNCQEKNKMLENIPSIGYRITLPDNYTDHAIRQYKSSVKAAERGNKVMQYAPVDKMSLLAQQAYREVQDRQLRLNAHLQGSIVEINYLNKRAPQALPPIGTGA